MVEGADHLAATAKDDATSLRQIPPVGPHPTAGVLFVGALLWSAPADAANVLAFIRDDDMPTLHLETVVAAVRRLVSAGTPAGPQLVQDELRRVGTLRPDVARDLQDATLSGAHPGALPEYGAAVLSEALRSRVESAGAALVEAAADAAEDDLAPLLTRALSACLDCSGRLVRLRGDS